MSLINDAEAAAEKNPSAAPKKCPDAWYPRTEKVADDEIFVVAPGTGMPTPITRAQKSAAWYVELGNGDIFLFDCGTGFAENLFALEPDFMRVDFAIHECFYAAEGLASYLGWGMRQATYVSSYIHTPPSMEYMKAKRRDHDV